MPKKKVSIIGAGIAGLAAAIRLSAKGHTVDVYEANSQVGGKMGTYEKDGFRFDTGPSLFTLPNLVDELLALSPQGIAFSYKRLETVCKYFYEDGTVLNAYADTEKFAQEVNSKTSDTAERTKKYFAEVKRAYDICTPIFLEKSLHSISTYLRPSFARMLTLSPGLVTKSLHRFHQSFWEDEKMVQLCDRFATYNGSNPYRAPAILKVIGHLEHGLGAYFPKGGMVTIAETLYKTALSLGAKFHFNQKVDRILLEEQEVVGLKVGGLKIPADLVVSNMDVERTYHELIPNVKKPPAISKNAPSTSAILFLWGIKRKFPELDLHNIFFSGDYEMEFKKLFSEKTIGDDPTIYINVSAKQNPGDAPEGMENWFVMVNTPAMDKQNWPELIEKTRKNVLRKISKTLGTDISQEIVLEKVLDPKYLTEMTMSHLGTLYGRSHNHKFSAFRRHPNHCPAVEGLYFCGGTVHPGGGVPLCLLSAKIVDEMIA